MDTSRNAQARVAEAIELLVLHRPQHFNLTKHILERPDRLDKVNSELAPGADSEYLN